MPVPSRCHGLSREFLSDKPRFHDVVADFIEFIRDAELIIHNAPFDITFLEHELSLLQRAQRLELDSRMRGSGPHLQRLCRITDSLAVARHKHPGQKNNLDALCRRYDVDNSSRQLHGALLDAEILAEVYLRMTGGQTALFALDTDADASERDASQDGQWQAPEGLLVVAATDAELAEHERVLDLLDQASAGALWRAPDADDADGAPVTAASASR